jgi:hypothetical protein
MIMFEKMQEAKAQIREMEKESEDDKEDGGDYGSED